MKEDERKIIEGLRQGDNWAYKHLYDSYYVLMCKIASAFLQDEYSAQMLIDEFIVHLYETREKLIIKTSLHAYLMRSVRNRCINYLQSAYEQKEIRFSNISDSEENLISIIQNEDYTINSLLGDELEQIIRSSIEHLPIECRTVFEKSRFEDKTYEMIASELNISVNTVKYHIKNALSHLRKDLDKYLLLILSFFYFF